MSLAGRRILNLMLGAGAGGLEAMAGHYHCAMESLGAQVLSVGRARSPFARTLAADPDSFAAFASPGGWDVTAPARLRRVTASFAPDLIIAHGTRAQALAARAFAAPTAAVVHNFRSKPALARCALAVCVSPAVQRSVQAAFPRLATAVVENFEPLAAAQVAPDFAHPPRIGTIGRLHPNKGYDILLDAAARLRAEGRAFRLSIAGDGPDASALKAQAARLGLTESLDFPGWVDPPAALAEMDVFVSASRVEPFGLVVIEAMAAGRPVVATDIDGPRDILAAGDLGVLAPPDDAAGLARAIAAVLDDPAAALARAARAQAAALATYSMEAGAARLQAALSPLIGR